jgi:hypothetical protein
MVIRCKRTSGLAGGGLPNINLSPVLSAEPGSFGEEEADCAQIVAIAALKEGIHRMHFANDPWLPAL